MRSNEDRSLRPNRAANRRAARWGWCKRWGLGALVLGVPVAQMPLDVALAQSLPQGGNIVGGAMGFDPTGRYLDEAHPHVGATPGFFARYEQVAATGIPSRRRGKALLWRRNEYREIENILLPLASDGRTVDMIMIYTSLLRSDGAPAR